MVVKYIKVTFLTMVMVLFGLVFSTTKIQASELTAVTNLTGSIWVGNSVISSSLTNNEFEINCDIYVYDTNHETYISDSDTSIISFSNNDTSRVEFYTDDSDTIMRYSTVSGKVGWYYGLTWYYPISDITITFTGGTDVTNTELISWLQANGTLNEPDVPNGYTQEDLDNAWADGYDVGISTVHENGFAGIYNPFTGQFYNNENSFSYIHGHYVGYNEAVDGFDYESYYSLGIKMAYMNGFGGYINPLTNEYYDITNSFSYIKGFNEALAEDYTFTGLLFQVFDGIGSVLSIELLPNITLGAIVAVPIVFGILYFILGKRKGD